jgi:hypothetical protein
MWGNRVKNNSWGIELRIKAGTRLRTIDREYCYVKLMTNMVKNNSCEI